MFEHMESVRLAEKEYPIKCDINVLIEIQEQFQTLNNFEMQITGVEIVKDENGSAVMNNEGKMLFKRVEPSIKAISKILPCMLKEAADAGENIDLKEALSAIQNAQFELYETACKIHTEYSKCFERKNV